jgi:gliding motility-associated lipoprotein GldJ
MTLKNLSSILSLFILLTLLSGCDYANRSGSTGWEYNTHKNGGFEKSTFFEQETGPGLILVEGGTFTMGQVEDDLMGSWDNSPRRVTVSSFYMDETEVTNHFWLEYITWLERVHGENNSEIVDRALPDTLAWREKLAYNEPLVKYYLRHPAYRDYPVVGVSWRQATEFCKWRTDRVNEGILIREGLLNENPGQIDEDHFTTESYLNKLGQVSQYNYVGDKEGVKDYSQKDASRFIRLEDGLLLPDYRLPTEAEWEYAALGLIGNSYGELIEERRTYPWDGHFVRNPNDRSKNMGDINANFVRGRGDFMGVAGGLNDFGDITVDVHNYAPNDYGLFNMAGNVNEWVMDVYRPFSNLDNEEFRPFRGNNYQTQVLNSEGDPAEKYDYVVYDLNRIKVFLDKYVKGISIGGRGMGKEDEELIGAVVIVVNDALEKSQENQDEESVMTLITDVMEVIKTSDALMAADLRKGLSDNIIAVPGDMKYRDVRLEENLNRTNYRVADNIDYRDGDTHSSKGYGTPQETNIDSKRMYDYENSTLVNNESRVYKGGSWNDRAYWLVPGTRRFLDERKSSSTVGFRCAMTRLGSPVPGVPFQGQ